MDGGSGLSSWPVHSGPVGARTRDGYACTITSVAAWPYGAVCTDHLSKHGSITGVQQLRGDPEMFLLSCCCC